MRSADFDKPIDEAIDKTKQELDELALLEKGKATIEDTKPKDRNSGYPTHVPRWFTRTVEIVPGIFTWLMILLPFITALMGYPQVIIIYVSFLTIYWSYRGVKFLVSLFMGYSRYKHDMAFDFAGEMVKVAKESGQELPYYVYICPVVNEGMDVLEPTFEAFAKQDIDPKRISVVFALEERFEAVSKPNAEKIIEKFGSNFRESMISVHPNDIEGEVLGVKGANINWATRNFVKIVKARGEDIADYLLITADSDMRPHPKYLSAITWKYLTDDKPLRRFYSTAIHTFNNNVWRVPPINRVFSISLTMALFHDWVVRGKKRETFSSYVVNLQTVHDVGYWDPQIGIDDTTFYWNALIRFAGDFSGKEVYIPTYNDAVENQTFWKSHKSLYKQQHRWGWGIIVFPMTFAGLYKNKDVPFMTKMRMIFRVTENQLLFLTVVYTITLSLPILQIFSIEYQYSAASYNLARMMRYILTVLMFFNIPIFMIRQKITPSPSNWPLWRKILDFFEVVLVSINMLTIGFIPKIHAQTEMLLNRFNKKYYATEKVAIKK
ncbi:MAG: glycosyltransferase family 2 protein [Candidatus Dojkabacteria bacterium]|nr:MAG: glycosyltransferase family 2 protein [Candidatus Dojkabacteria bacterium]